MTLTVQRFVGDGADWDRFVTGQTGWTHFHLHGWKHVVERVFGHKCIYLACRSSSGLLEGVLPLVRVRSRLFGHFVVSMPFVNYGGPLGSDRAVRALTDEVLKIAQRDRVELLELRSRRRLPLSLPVSHRKLTVLVDLAGNPEVVWKSLSTKTRTKVRRSRKCGVEVHIGPDELRPFYHVFARHMRDLGTPSQSEQFFRSIQETFPESVRFGCAYLDGVPIAGGCGFRWGEEFEITWSSALRTHNKVRSNYLLHWSFMESAAREGCTTYNFGRSTPGSGTHEFKRQWSGRDVPLWWYHVGRAGVSQTPSPDQGRYSWGPRIWRRLPLRLAMTLGPRIVRCIP